MSGGVDSSVAALLLLRQGVEVVGLSMHLRDHDPDGSGSALGRCCTADDLSDARRAADALGIPHYVVNLVERFASSVVRPFVESYLAGETPIPCLACNTDLKFSALLERAAALGCEAVATGHYARVERDEATGELLLLRGSDAAKDQSYFLHGLSQSQLARALFPLGELPKTAVREMARGAGLSSWDKPDSQEVCFVHGGEGPGGFVRREAAALGISLPAIPAALPGRVVDREGRVLGRHDGAFQFTVGQRRGLGVASGKPLYVIEVATDSGDVVVGPEEELLSCEVPLRELRFVSGRPPVEGERVLARIRSRHQEQPARFFPASGGLGCLLFDEPVRAPAPGQSAVLFDAGRPERVLGGGVIRRTTRPGRASGA